MHEADDVYMGYAGKEELTAILTELLEAERARVRVTHESALTARGGPLGELMRAIEKDDARWCAMLTMRALVIVRGGWRWSPEFQASSRSICSRPTFYGADRKTEAIGLSELRHASRRPRMDDLLWTKRSWSGASAYAESKPCDVLLAFAIA